MQPIALCRTSKVSMFSAVLMKNPVHVISIILWNSHERKYVLGWSNDHGIGCLCPVEGMENWNCYIDAVEKTFPTDKRQVFSKGSWIFQQDFMPCSTSNVVTKLFKDNHREVQDWLANSPDLNPIENLWAYAGWTVQ